MKKRNLILASFIILLAILTGACSTQERSIPVQEADVALAENPVPKPDAAQAEIVNPIQSTGITSYLFAPIRSTTTYLMDAEGNALQTWESAYTPGNAVYLQENGNLLRTGSVKSTKFGVGGTGGITLTRSSGTDDYTNWELVDAISLGNKFQARREEQIKSSHYFCRVKSDQYNYSQNPTYYTGSNAELQNSTFVQDPKSYITTVGLYNGKNELLAVAKLSQPLLKSKDREAVIKVRLDF